MSTSEEYSLGKHWSVLKNNKTWILACALVAALSTGLFSLSQPKIFGAKTLILVSESKITEPDTKVSNFVYYELLRTYETFLFNDSLIQRTIENFGLQKDPYDLTVERFRRDRMLQVSLQKNTRLLEVSVEFPEARLAADIANFFAAQAVNLNEIMNAKDREKTVLFFRTEMERASQDLESSSKRLTEFNKASGVGETRDFVQSLLDRLTEDETNLGRLKVKLSGSLARRQGLFDEVKTHLPKTEPQDKSLPSQPPGPVWADGSSQSSQLTSLNQGPDSPVYRPLQSQIVEANSEVLALTAEIETLQQALQENSRKLDRLRQDKAVKEGMLSQLSLENKLAGENYSALRRKFQEAAVSVSARTIDLQQVSPALSPERPLRPRIALNSLLGGAFGFLASTLLTLLLQKVPPPEKREAEGRTEEKLREIRRSGKGY